MFVEINSRRIPLESGHLYMLGKQLNALLGENDKYFIQLEHKEDVDKKHCMIDVSQGKEVYIVDLYSSQGTLLNNLPLQSLNKTLLKNCDIIKVGSQEIKFFYDNEQQEMSHDSSGFLDVNRNTSDIVSSSPEYTSQRENRTKRLNNNFLVPPIPAQKRSLTPNTSSAETTLNNRRSDSFTIPETQYCKSRTSLNSSDLSIAESIPETNASKIKFNFGNLDDEDDEFCIPETQEPMQMLDNQKIQILVNGKKPDEPTILEEKTAELDAEDSTKDIDGSQFRMDTQEYNEGFGEEMGSLHSQIIPLIKHSTVILNSSSASTNNKTDKRNNDDKEITSIKWSDVKNHQETTNPRADCATPDIFDFNGLEENKKLQANKETKTDEPNILEEDEDDFLPTQLFSVRKQKEKILSDIDQPCVEKENEEILTSSDKENKFPVALEPIANLPPTQLFATNEAPIVRSTLSNSSRSSSSSALKKSTFAAPAISSTSSNVPDENKKNSKLSLNLDPDEEDDLLTQAFLLPSNSNMNSTANKNVAGKCFNSTLLDEKSINKNAATLFAEMEKSPVKQSTKGFKFPEREFSVVKKAASTTSATSESDLDLLMCTPQLIKEHLHVGMRDDLKKNILAAKNNYLFGDDTDEEEISDGPMDLVKLINVPKNFKDFDILLPHLKTVKQQNSNETEEQRAAKEAQKNYKFSISFGKQQESGKTSTSKSTKYSRDERHMARDRDRDLAEHKEKLKSNVKQNEIKERNTRSSKRLASTDKFETKEGEEIKNPKESKQNKRGDAKNNTKADDSEKTKKSVKTKKSKGKEKSNRVNEEKEESKTGKTIETNKSKQKDKVNQINEEKEEKQVEKQKPAKRLTHLKSINEDKASTSKEAVDNNKTKASQSRIVPEDDSDSVSTQPFVRKTRSRLNSKNDDSQGNKTSNSSLSKSAGKSEISSTENTSLNGNLKKTENERKRKAEPPLAKVERKRLRSTHSQEFNNSSNFSSKVCISMTMVDQEVFKELIKNSNGLWSIANNPAESEILVMDKAFRTFKFLLAMARGIPIVTSDYLMKVNELQSVKKVCVTDYLFSDNEFEKKHKFSLAKSLQMAKKQKLFKDYEFLMTPNIVPNPSEIKAIIEASGGIVHAKSPPEPTKDQQIYLVSSTEDKKDWHKYRRLNKNITIISTEAIMTSIIRQSCARISSYTLS